MKKDRAGMSWVCFPGAISVALSDEKPLHSQYQEHLEPGHCQVQTGVARRNRHQGMTLSGTVQDGMCTAVYKP